MGTFKSQEIYISLFLDLYTDIAHCYPILRDHKLDLMKIKSRLNSEGLSFLTKTLPKYGKAFDKALSSTSPLSIPGLKTGLCVTPKLFGWLLARVISKDGYVRKDADVTAVKHLRQLYNFCYKLKLPYAQSTCKQVIEQFVKTDQELKVPDLSHDPVAKQARVLISRVLSGLCPRDIIPRHGPGATATGESTIDKSRFCRLYKSLDIVYPFTEYFMLGLNHITDELSELGYLDNLEASTAKVVLVPKDSRGPRLISMEPLEIQWIQQGIREIIYNRVESHWLTRGHVNFTNQGVNRALALQASRTEEFVTLDMKDASDRVSNELVNYLFAGTQILEGLKATRSEFTLLPDGRNVRLNKFASMGSALCFPIEALVFWALSVSVVYLSGRSWRHALSTIYVYGDDIILRDKDYDLVMQKLPEYGLMFNPDKCCVKGSFRESCGCDAFNGVDVTPIRLRETWNVTRSASELTSYVALSNALHKAGYLRTAYTVKRKVESKYGNLPYLPCDSSSKSFCHKTLRMIRKDSSPNLLGWMWDDVNHRMHNKTIRRRFSRTLHRMEYYTWTVHTIRRKSDITGWKEVLRTLNCGSTGSNTSEYAIPRRVRLTRGWNR